MPLLEVVLEPSLRRTRPAAPLLVSSSMQFSCVLFAALLDAWLLASWFINDFHAVSDITRARTAQQRCRTEGRTACTAL